MSEYELETDEFGLAFMSAHDDFTVTILEELNSDTPMKYYRVKVQEVTQDADNQLHCTAIRSG